VDQTLSHLINARWTNPALDLLMAAVSDVNIWRPLLIIVALAAVVFGGFKMRACVFSLLLSLLIAQQVTNVLKSAINRARPSHIQSVRMVRLQKANPEFLALFKKPIIYSERVDRVRGGPSFPSGHMTNNTVIAMCLSIFYRRRGALYWILTATVGYSRIYLGAHWPSDVIGTVFLAAGETLLIIAALELTWRWAAQKWAPTIFARHSSLITDVEQVPSLPTDNSHVGNSRHKS
jgi:undecaprenyl-diphosphatase